ncbi:MAG TPA: ABC transporter ATP-binding protein [Streptosporangiaceae bacterium]|nr:ABC transporter ATP-binding protein [Streptosporangiaceae bacterium]
MNVIECRGLAKRYRRTWALRDCGLAIPEGHVVALVGPNGAGKTTLLKLAAGLLPPTAGDISVLGGQRPGSGVARVGIGFVSQDAPLYGHLRVRDMLALAENLNITWDRDRALARLADLRVPLDRKVGTLSGGQRAQLALTIALGKRPRLLILDEPLASLDPLARHEVMATLMAEVAEQGLSVVLSSHVLAELERIADYLVILNDGQLQLAGGVEDLLAVHRILTGPGNESTLDARLIAVIHARQAGAQAHLLVRNSAPPGAPAPEGWRSDPASLEDLVLGYLRDPGARMLPGPAMAASAGGPAVTP